jgi:hypothetical protein
MMNGVVGVAHVPPTQADPDLAKARRMLADWETCPSRKTSAGQAKIKQYTAEVNELVVRDNKAQMEKSRQSEATTRDAAYRGAAGSGISSAAPMAPGQGSNVAGIPLGATIDVYA